AHALGRIRRVNECGLRVEPAGREIVTAVSALCTTIVIQGVMARHREERICQQSKFNGNFCRFSTVPIRGRVFTTLSYRRLSRSFPATAPVPVAGPPSSTG